MEYKSGITCITPSGLRPLGLKRALYYLERQTLLPNQWIISDDTPQPEAASLELMTSSKFDVVHKQRPNSENKAKSFTGNILNCLSSIEYNHVFVIEDDDWYAPQYLELYSLFFQQGYQLVGETKAIYYNIRKNRYRTNGNTNRASFCQTAFTANVIPKLRKLCELKRESAFVDARLWNYARENGIPNKLFSGKRLAVGIKGIPGRQGIGIGHRPTKSAYHADPDWKTLEKFIGSEDTKFYKQLMHL